MDLIIKMITNKCLRGILVVVTIFSIFVISMIVSQENKNTPIPETKQELLTKNNTLIQKGLVDAAGSSINSIQKGTISIAATASSNTASITSVDTSKAYVIFDGFTALSECEGTDEGQRSFARVTLTSSTVVTANRGVSDNTCSMTVAYTVVEWA